MFSRLPDGISLLVGLSAKRHYDEPEFQEALHFCVASISNSHMFNDTQFSRPDGLENICQVLETSLQNKFEYPIVLTWRLEADEAHFYLDVFFEQPNAPFSHSQGALH